jgi:hypothetical protein
MITCRLVSTKPRFFRAEAPHRMNTTRSGLALTARRTSSVKVSQPLPWCDAAWLARTVRVALRRSTPWRGPGIEAAVRRRIDPEVVAELLVDVHQRRRRGHTLSHREAEAVGLAGAVVRILSEDHDLHRLERGEVQRREHVLVRRVHRRPSPLGGDELLQLGPVRLGELPPEHRVPVGAVGHPAAP